MKLALLIFTLFSAVMLSSNAFARDDWEVFNCLPTLGQLNGFGTKSMKLKVSTEHPEAHYTLVRKNQSVEKGLMDYEGSDSQFTINGDEYTIAVRREKKGIWIATLTHESIELGSFRSGEQGCKFRASRNGKELRANFDCQNFKNDDKAVVAPLHFIGWVECTIRDR